MSGYIGTQPVPQATQTRDSFTATSGQTSFATGGYTPNFLDVYLNGVKLASADYTATNGSDVVLASGAATGDILEVVAFTTFNSASSSIDDNGNATAITIDSNENVLIGKTTTSFGTQGVALRNNRIQSTNDGGSPLELNRLTSDGDIALFQKNGSTVGSIGANSNRLQIQSGSGGDLILGTGSNADAYRLSDAVFYPSVGDATADLGLSNRRFKDAYLSGGVFLGGTGSANKLSDFETGTWTPDISWTGVNAETYSRQVGSYVKIGQFVYCSIAIIFDKNTSTGNFGMGGFPFTNNASSSNDRGVGSFGYYSGMTNGSTAPLFLMEHNSNFGYFRLSGGGGSGNGNDVMNNSSIGSSVNFHMDVVYRTTQ